MNINVYLRALIDKAVSLYTPSTLEIPIQLCQLFHQLRETADQNVQEHGRSMYWQKNQEKYELTPSPQNYVGGIGGNSVDLQTIDECNKKEYIGDFHVHPYKAKYGSGISIAPSNGDWDVWWKHPPKSQQIAVHFVASGNDLFVVIFRRIPVAELSYKNVTADAGRLNDAVRTWLVKDQIAYGEFLQAGNWGKAREILTENSPDAIRHHQDDAHAMNRALANANSCEYYKGTLRNGVSRVDLVSNRVLGNWFTANIWMRNTDRWF